MIFQRCELRTLAAPPVFSRSKQSPTDALILVPAAYPDLRYVAVDHFSVHRIQRLFETGVYEPNDLTAELRHKSDTLSTRVRRMLQPFSAARRSRRNCRDRIAFRIKAGMIFSTFEEPVGDSVSIF